MRTLPVESVIASVPGQSARSRPVNARAAISDFRGPASKPRTIIANARGPRAAAARSRARCSVGPRVRGLIGSTTTRGVAGALRPSQV
ncbi:hypothetical protein ACIHAX_15875 [Nocardia sp. NPDC051929]|uniref:hypothetical protein n=1 Tax=Nocardia sp. NPDC051929 TaxID=3364327 RepID=UPI0037CA279A